MKKQTWRGNWKVFLIRLFLGAFLPALTTYLALNFLLSLWMNSSESSWLAFFIAAVVWNFCNYLMGHTIANNTALDDDDEGRLLNRKTDEPYSSIYHYCLIRNHHIKSLNRNDF